MTYTYGFYFAQPWWLVACLLLGPIIWLGRRNLAALGPVRRTLAIILRCLVTLLLVALLARPTLTRESRRLTVIPIVDRSQSIPAEWQQASLDYLDKALTKMDPRDQLAVVDVAEVASIQAVKKTPDLIPLCHPIPITSVSTEYEVGEEEIEARCRVVADYKTGVEMEALTGVTIALLNIWDMVKYLEKDEAGQYPETCINDIRVVLKQKE